MTRALLCLFSLLAALLGARAAPAAPCNPTSEAEQLAQQLRRASAKHESVEPLLKALRDRCDGAQAIVERALERMKYVPKDRQIGPKPSGNGSGPLSVSEPVYRACVADLKQNLSATLRDLQSRHGGFENVEATERRAFLLDLQRFLARVAAADAPAGLELEAVDLLARIAAESREVRLAEALTEAIERMTPAQREHLRQAHPDLEQALGAADGTQRVAFLLEHFDEANRAYPEAIAAVGPSAVAVAGRPVILAREFDPSELAACSGKLDASLRAAFFRRRPGGVLIFNHGDRADADVTVRTTVLSGSSQTHECSSGHCLELRVNMALEGKSETIARRRDVWVYSESFDCNSVGSGGVDAILEQAIGNVYASFAAEFDAGDTSATRASLVKPECLGVQGNNVAALWASARQQLAPATSGLTLAAAAGSDWPIFEQSLRDALSPYQERLHLLPPLGNAGVLRLSWDAPRGAGGAPPKSVKLSLRTGQGAEEVLEQTFTPARQKECLDSPSLEQTIALRATLWLVAGLFGAEPALASAPQTSDAPARPKAPWTLRLLALPLAGLPQLLDGDATNDVRGGILAGVDVGLLTTSGVLILYSVGERQRYSERRGSLAKSNSLLHAGMLAGGAVIIPRVISFAW